MWCGFASLLFCLLYYLYQSNSLLPGLPLVLQGYSGNASGPSGAPMPPPGSMYSGASGGSGAKPPTSSGPPGPPTSREAPPGGPPGPHPAQRPPSGYPGPYGGPPGPRPPGPMYPGIKLKNVFPLQQLRCCCRKGKRGWWGVHCPCLISGTRQGRSSDPLGHCTTPP